MEPAFFTFQDAFLERWKKRHGIAYPFNSDARQQMGTITDRCNDDVGIVQHLVAAFFETNDEWVIGQKHQLADLEKRLPKYLAIANEKKKVAAADAEARRCPPGLARFRTTWREMDNQQWSRLFRFWKTNKLDDLVDDINSALERDREVGATIPADPVQWLELRRWLMKVAA